jgi:hypothetical protein
MTTTEPAPGADAGGSGDCRFRAGVSGFRVAGAAGFGAGAAFATGGVAAGLGRAAGLTAGFAAAVGAASGAVRRVLALAGRPGTAAVSLDDLLSASSLMPFSASASRPARSGRRRLLVPAYSEWPRQR